MSDEGTQDNVQTDGAATQPQGRQQPQEQQQATITMTQEQFDKAIKDRLARQKQQFADYDELRARAEKLTEIEESQKSAEERFVSALERANQQAQQAQEREKQALERMQSTLVRSAVIAEASRQQAIDPDAVYALLDKNSLTIGDGDQVNGVSEAVSALLAERSYLAGNARTSNGGGGFDGGARQTAPAGTTNADFNAMLRKGAGFA